MMRRTGGETDTAEDVIAMYEVWSGLSASGEGSWMTGLGPQDGYVFLGLRGNLRYMEPPDDTGNRLSSGITEKYRQLGSWLEPRLEWVRKPISASSVIDVVEDHWPHHHDATVDLQTTDWDQTRDFGSMWQTFDADGLRVDNRTVTTQHDPAGRISFPDPGTLVEVIRDWLVQFYDDELANLLTGELEEDEVERNLQKLEDAGAIKLADRFKFLLSDDAAEEDGDVPLAAEAALGFFDFIDAVEYEGLSMSATCAFGRLCTQWKYDDGRSLVLWFNNRTETSLTAFGCDRKLLKNLGRDSRAAELETAVNLLVEANFFTCRHDPSG